MKNFRVLEGRWGDRYWFIEALDDGIWKPILGGGLFKDKEVCYRHLRNVEQAANGYWTDDPPPTDGTRFQADYPDGPVTVWWSDVGAQWKMIDKRFGKPTHPPSKFSHWRPLPQAADK